MWRLFSPGDAKPGHEVSQRPQGGLNHIAVVVDLGPCAARIKAVGHGT